MKKNISLIFLAAPFLGLLPAHAQFTEGGSTKSYEKYRYSVDTIVTARTITNTTQLPQGRQSYFYFSVGLAAPLSTTFSQKADPNSSISDSYGGRDGMGGKIGGSFSLGGFYAFKSLNNKLIPLLDLGLAQNHTLGIHAYNWKNVNSFYSNDVKYNPFISFGSTLAPTVVINPLWKTGGKLHIDVGYKLGAAVVFGGGQEYDGYDFTYLIERENFTKPHFLHGPSIRVRYSLLFVGLDFNFMKDNTDDAYYLSSTDDFGNYNTSYFDSRTNLSNFSFHVGLAF